MYLVQATNYTAIFATATADEAIAGAALLRDASPADFTARRLAPINQATTRWALDRLGPDATDDEAEEVVDALAAADLLVDFDGRPWVVADLTDGEFAMAVEVALDLAIDHHPEPTYQTAPGVWSSI